MAGETTRGTRSNPDLDARSLELLLAYEHRLEEKLLQIRAYTKEDIQTAMTINIQPVNGKLDMVTARLQRGDERFSEMESMIREERERAANQSERINQILVKCRGHEVSTALEKSKQAETRRVDRGSSGWISVDKLPAIITAIGSLVAVVVSSIALTRSPNVTPTTAATPPTPAVRAATGAP
jgi:hypothetical protein